MQERMDWERTPDPARGSALPQMVSPPPGARSSAWIDRLAAHECPAITARRARRAEVTGQNQDPIVWARARGANVWDVDGNRYVDLSAGFGVASVGHAHPVVAARVAEQVARLPHAMGDAYPSRERIELADRLATLLPGRLSQSIFGSSGSEAVEAALKTAVMVTGRHHFLALEHGYHGLTLGALGVTHYRASFKAPFAELIAQRTRHLPLPESWRDPDSCTDDCALALERALTEGPPVAALVIEPIQGRGGLRPLPARWLQRARALTRAHGALLIVDEIFTGIGRTGRWLACEHAGIEPDVVCVGKGLSGGLPISAAVGTPAVMGAWGHSKGEAIHTSTFLGNPTCASMALATLEVLESCRMLQHATRLGSRVSVACRNMQQKSPHAIRDTRGVGLMWGIELRPPPGVPVVALSLSVCRRALQQGLIMLPCGFEAETLPLHPPLCLHPAQLDHALGVIERLIGEEWDRLAEGAA